jgi:hypothetical protein
MLINGKISVKDFFGYVVAQIAGAFAGSGMLALIVSMTELRNTGLGANGFGEASAVGLTMVGALIVEIIATCTELPNSKATIYIDNNRVAEASVASDGSISYTIPNVAP